MSEESEELLSNANQAMYLKQLHQKYHELIIEKQKEFVSQGAILACTKGKILTKLDAHSATDISAVGSGRSILGCNACKNYENVHSFFSCRATDKESAGLPKRDKMADGYYKCIPLVDGEWKQDNDKTPIIWNNTTGEKSYVLKKDAILTCRYKGIIGIIEPGDNNKGLGEMTVSPEYIDFVVNYEGGNTSSKWQYAQDLGDGAITVAFGVVIKDKDGNYPLGKAKYDELMDLKNRNIALTWDEALDLTTNYMDTEYSSAVNEKALEEGWSLNQNRFDALVDMTWNCGTSSLKYQACKYLATGDLSDATILSQLKKEIAETAHMEIGGVNMWTKNLVERRLDVIRIVQGGSDAYTRNEFTAQDWNQNANTILLNMGLTQTTINLYPLQKMQV